MERITLGKNSAFDCEPRIVTLESAGLTINIEQYVEHAAWQRSGDGEDHFTLDSSRVFASATMTDSHPKDADFEFEFGCTGITVEQLEDFATKLLVALRAGREQRLFS